MNRFLPLLLLMLLIPLFTACERAPSPLPEGAVILAFGDGITYGTGTDGKNGYPAALEGLVGRKVVNAGVSGETTAQGLKRLPALLDEVRPQLVVLCHGGEDMTQKLEADQLMANLNEMVRLILKSGAEVLLVAVPPPGPYFQPAPFYVQISREMEVPIEVNALSNLLSDKELRHQGIQPNAKGNVVLAKAIAKRITTVQR